MAALPQRFRNAVSGLSDIQLSTPYREGGWTVRQLIHHLPDSHLNAYIRCKLALTEDSPTIKPYDQEAWANLADSALTPPEVSLSLLEAVHTRWVTLLRALTPDDFQRKFNHPETGVQSVDSTVAFYAWHGNHHLGHITALRERMKW
jgi:uncharacterized damage-inducible protein DinB